MESLDHKDIGWKLIDVLKTHEQMVIPCEKTMELELAKDLQNNERYVILGLSQSLKNELMVVRMGLDDLKDFEKKPNSKQLIKSVLDNTEAIVLKTISKFNEALSSPYLNLLQKAFVGGHLTYTYSMEVVTKGLIVVFEALLQKQ